MCILDKLLIVWCACLYLSLTQPMSSTLCVWVWMSVCCVWEGREFSKQSTYIICKTTHFWSGLKVGSNFSADEFSQAATIPFFLSTCLSFRHWTLWLVIITECVWMNLLVLSGDSNYWGKCGAYSPEYQECRITELFCFWKFTVSSLKWHHKIRGQFWA